VIHRLELSCQPREAAAYCVQTCTGQGGGRDLPGLHPFSIETVCVCTKSAQGVRLNSSGIWVDGSLKLCEWHREVPSFSTYSFHCSPTAHRPHERILVDGLRPGPDTA